LKIWNFFREFIILQQDNNNPSAVGT